MSISWVDFWELLHPAEQINSIQVELNESALHTILKSKNLLLPALTKTA